jgi:hypothetical protein
MAARGAEAARGIVGDSGAALVWLCLAQRGMTGPREAQ